MPKEKKKNQCRSDKNPRYYSVVPTPHELEQDFFYYIGKDDEVEVIESLGYNLKQDGYLEEDSRVSKYW